jgi:hypothetical protein
MNTGEEVSEGVQTKNNAEACRREPETNYYANAQLNDNAVFFKSDVSIWNNSRSESAVAAECGEKRAQKK